MSHSSTVDEKHSTAEDSDQEELDDFIAQIEKAADDEWAAEEEAEKEEAGKIRYWNKEDIGNRFRRSGMTGSDESDDETGGRSSGRSKTYGRKIGDDDEQDGVSDDDSELDDDDGRRGSSVYTNTHTYNAPVRHPKYKTENWQKGKSNRPINEGGSRRNFDPYLKGTMASDRLSDLEEAMWISDDEGGQNSTQPSEYRSSSDEEEDYDKVATWESDAEDAPGLKASRGAGNSFRTGSQGQMKKNDDTRESKTKAKSSKDMDETWDSD